MGLLPKDVECSLPFQELRLQTDAAGRGRQILPRSPGAHVRRRRVMAESAAGAQASPHACKHTDINKSHTHSRRCCSLHVHMLSNKLRLNDEQITCAKRFPCTTAVQQGLWHSFSPPTKQLPRFSCVEILETEEVGILLQVNKSRSMILWKPACNTFQSE